MLFISYKLFAYEDFVGTCRGHIHHLELTDHEAPSTVQQIKLISNAKSSN